MNASYEMAFYYPPSVWYCFKAVLNEDTFFFNQAKELQVI